MLLKEPSRSSGEILNAIKSRIVASESSNMPFRAVSAFLTVLESTLAAVVSPVQD